VPTTRLSKVLAAAAAAAMDAKLTTSFGERRARVAEVHKLWLVAEQVGFPLRDANVKEVALLLGGLEGDPKPDLSWDRDCSRRLDVLAHCAEWAEAAVEKFEVTP
jgi:hypothetical protein